MRRVSRPPERMTRQELVAEVRRLRGAPGEHLELSQAVHDLQVHQEELASQRDQLVDAQRQLEHSRDVYADLYDYAPLPYITLDESTRWSLAEARRRGVRVRIVTEGEITDAMPVKHASRYGYQQLLDQGIEIYEYRPTMMHTKAVMVDEAFSVIGSANFGNRSFELNDELTVAVFDPELARTLTQDFEADIAASEKLDAATWAGRRSIFGKAQEFFWSYFAEIF